MKQIQCNKCGKYFEVEEHEEWGYCPFCENDQVEVPKRFEQWGHESFKDNETGEIHDNYIELLNQQDQQISDLEAKLAESEEKLSLVKNTSIYKTQMEITHLRVENADLKQQLSESERETKKLQDKWEKLKVWANSDGFIHLTSVKQMFLEKIEKGE